GFPPSLAAVAEPKAFPNIQITGFGAEASIPNVITGGFLGSTDKIRLGNDSHSAQANVTKVLSRHTIKAGGEFRAVRLNAQQSGANTPVFSFTPAYTQGPNAAASSSTAGSALASFLLGLPASSTINPAPAIATQNVYYGFFLQDNWKVTDRFTINAGIRYEFESPRTERFNQLTNFDFDAQPPLAGTGLDFRGALAFVGTGSLGRYNSNPDRNNFAPRLGFAWTVTPRTVIRGGGGLFYAGITGIGTGSEAFGISGFSAATSMLTSLDGVTPVNDLSNPYPTEINRPTGNTLGSATLLGQSVQFTDRANRTPYSAQWNFNIQRELPGNAVFEIGYLGSRGLNFPQNRQLNQLPDSALALGDALRQQVPNPFFGQITTGTLAGRTVARAQLLRPFPHFDGVQSNNAAWASSTYHAMSMKLERRFSRGFTALGSYTWSKLMDYGIGPFAGEELGGQAFQNWNNLAADWSPSTLDQTHRFILNAVYELPFLREQRGFTGKLFGGWQVSGILSAFSGGPIGVNSAVNNTFSQGGGQRPNWTGVNPVPAQQTPQRWIDPAQFSVPAPYTFGNAPRTMNGLRTDGTGQFDMALLKTTTVRENLRLQFRAEAFNASNTPRFGPPNSNFGNQLFGVVSAMGNSPRVLQFALKLMY
ncbi:MAG TPA: TonB-dependent receptor, partial [Bryobacteraceae bacterium]|nr:TonB-dependent receptor [Bryobacteraceae bacterium]